MQHMAVQARWGGSSCGSCSQGGLQANWRCLCLHERGRDWRNAAKVLQGGRDQKRGPLLHFKAMVLNKLSLFCQTWLLNYFRNENHNPEDVLPCVQKSLEDLQLDYLDLYLVHGPMELKKGAFQRFPNFEEDDKLGYDADRMAKTWQVSQSVILHVYMHIQIMPHYVGHGGTCEQGAGQGHWNL